MQKVINFYGGPNSGKSTQASGLFYKMKMAGYDVELVDEFAKECVWENNIPMLKDQLFVLAHQHRKILRLAGKVDYIITDSPVLLSPIYREMYDGPLYSDLIDELALECYYMYDNINLVLERPKEFNQNGRAQNLEESIMVDKEIIRRFGCFDIDYKSLSLDNAVDEAFDYIKLIQKLDGDA